jgi:predicted GIY-YIG superfamily endonuclease
MTAPHAMADFALEGVGIRTLLQRFQLEDDFRGCYVLMKAEQPVYVGISQGVLRRLRQHVRGATHFDASLAYRMAASRRPHGLTRSGAMAEAEFQSHFRNRQQHLRSLNVAFVEISNPLELYVFEAFAAMELDTCEWNTFETH